MHLVCFVNAAGFGFDAWFVASNPISAASPGSLRNSESTRAGSTNRVGDNGLRLTILRRLEVEVREVSVLYINLPNKVLLSIASCQQRAHGTL